MGILIFVLPIIFYRSIVFGNVFSHETVGHYPFLEYYLGILPFNFQGELNFPFIGFVTRG